MGARPLASLPGVSSLKSHSTVYATPLIGDTSACFAYAFTNTDEACIGFCSSIFG